MITITGSNTYISNIIKNSLEKFLGSKQMTFNDILKWAGKNRLFLTYENVFELVTSETIEKYADITDNNFSFHMHDIINLLPEEINLGDALAEEIIIHEAFYNCFELNIELNNNSKNFWEKTIKNINLYHDLDYGIDEVMYDILDLYQFKYNYCIELTEFLEEESINFDLKKSTDKSADEILKNNNYRLINGSDYNYSYRDYFLIPESTYNVLEKISPEAVYSDLKFYNGCLFVPEFFARWLCDFSEATVYYNEEIKQYAVLISNDKYYRGDGYKLTDTYGSIVRIPEGEIKAKIELNNRHKDYLETLKKELVGTFKNKLSIK